jgi:hypothetical protein
MDDIDEEVSEDLLDELRSFEDYHEAIKYDLTRTRYIYIHIASWGRIGDEILSKVS